MVFYAFLYGHVDSAEYPKGGRGAHPAAPVHDANSAGDDPDRQASVCIHDGLCAGGCASDRGAPDLWHSLGRISPWLP